MKYRPDIDGLRAVAILPVVLYHAGFPGISGGFIGVDVFFVISGFLITSIVATEIRENRFSLLRFYERRARRIVPALAAVVMATLAAGWFILLPSEFKDLGQSALATAVFLSNVYFSLKLDYFAPAAEFAPLLHTWSLAVEEQFYLFFPPLLVFLFGWFGSRLTVWAVLGLSALSLAAAVVMLPGRPDWVFYLIFFRAWELGIGALLALYRLPTPSHPVPREIIGLAGLAAILIPVVLYEASTPFPGLAALPPVLGTAALIYVGSNPSGSAVNKSLSHPFCVWIGLISYSLYLWHWPILSLLRVMREDVYLPLSLGVAAVVLSMALAWLSYKFIEQPFRAKPPTGFSQKTILSLASFALLAMIVLGGLLHATNGVPNRIAPDIRAIADVAQDQNPDRPQCFNALPSQGLCSLGPPIPDGEAIDFLVWGDSHAEAMRYGFDLAAKEAGQSGLFAGASACPPIRQIIRTPELQSCTEMNQSVWTFLQERSDAPLVVLAARWPLSVQGSRYRQEAGSPVVLDWSGPPEKRPSNGENTSIFEAGLTATVEDILSTGRRVVVIGSIPEVGWNVPRLLARKEMIGAMLEPPSLTEADFDRRAGSTERILSKLAERYEDVEYLRLSDLFCADGVCSIASEDGLPLYRDDDHISRSTAETLLQPRFSDIWAGESE